MFRVLSSGVVLNRFATSTPFSATTTAACAFHTKLGGSATLLPNSSAVAASSSALPMIAAASNVDNNLPNNYYSLASSSSSSFCAAHPSTAFAAFNNPASFFGGHNRSLFSSTRVSLQRGGGSSGGSGDYYATLGVSPDASPEEVKASYKRLALQYHPDRNRAADAEEKFKTISEAYAVIGNKEKRAEYDSVRRSGFSGFGSGGGGNSSNGQGSTYQGQRGFSRGGSGFKHGQGMRQGGQQPRPGQHPHVRTLSREEAEQMFRSIFNMGIEQMAAAGNANRGVGGGGPLGGMPGMPGMGRGMPRGNGLNSNLGSLFTNIAQQSENQHPFFRAGRGGGGGGAQESTRVEFDEFGNRSVHRQFKDANGNIYNIYTEESDDPNASMNQTKEQVNEKYYDPRTGRYSYGTYGSVGEDKGGGGFTNWGGIKGGGGGPNAEQAGGGEGAQNTGGSSDGSNSRAYPEYAQFIYRNTPIGGNPAIRMLYIFLWTSLLLTLGIYLLIFLFSHPILLALVFGIIMLRRIQPVRRF